VVSLVTSRSEKARRGAFASSPKAAAATAAFHTLASFRPTATTVPGSKLEMVAPRRTPETLFPSIERVMISAGLAPPLPTVVTPTKSRFPSRWQPRTFRYHPYARTTLPDHYANYDNTEDVFTVCSSRFHSMIHCSRALATVLGRA
jgi:hypothetical protein